ncbi:AAA ATPase central domain protein [Geobacter metallireducens RCH3]|uniref:Replication-associated recombination protein A n=1 Tax=Geobacter metallireducens (strain ATCC 53774 / DSM 7210 / GS-15) TaxID=269799 RepID=Q39X43_GEOMG|nr:MULTISPECIES: replication-associated recombination protein A [Geobacter]ABB31181.1 stalled replication fork rescue ATPase [Geobacter metallireducens GS-15]EHP84498.1 AAA ATPase central domain protein [Geobacter metallireducens RCH3]MBT1076625.1 replication-associated recombination protein A [Geobacter grbiciae]
MTDLFDATAATETGRDAPLAERMRPRTLDDYVGQEHLLGEGKLLRRLIESDTLSSLIFWGPPGSGKTTLARIIANATKSHFIFFSAILSGVKEIREIVKEAENERKYRGSNTILFVDEIHRFNKSQQDAFLPYVEKGVFTIIGATTENPSFEVIAPLLSRCKVLVLNSLTDEEVTTILRRALVDPERGLGNRSLAVSDEALAFMAEQAQGDARIALNTLETAARLAKNGEIDLDSAREAAQKKALLYDKGGEEHYNVISAFIKSMRGSDPDGALYWLARMIEAGEDPLFILRRMVILASEDIGNADPRALQVAVAALQAFQLVGMPEGRIIMAQAVTYLATAPKSNASYAGIDAALAEVRKSGALPVPLHIRNAPTRLMKDLGYHAGYKYAHDYEGGHVSQEYLPEQLRGKTFYAPRGHGYEKTIKERMEYLRTLQERNKQ